MTAQVFTRIGLRLLGVYFVVCGSPIVPACLLSLLEVPGFSVARQDVDIHHSYFVALVIQPPPVTAMTYLICGVILIGASRRVGRWLLRGIGADEPQNPGAGAGGTSVNRTP